MPGGRLAWTARWPGGQHGDDEQRVAEQVLLAVRSWLRPGSSSHSGRTTGSPSRLAWRTAARRYWASAANTRLLRANGGQPGRGVPDLDRVVGPVAVRGDQQRTERRSSAQRLQQLVGAARVVARTSWTRVLVPPTGAATSVIPDSPAFSAAGSTAPSPRSVQSVASWPEPERADGGHRPLVRGVLQQQAVRPAGVHAGLPGQRRPAARARRCARRLRSPSRQPRRSAAAPRRRAPASRTAARRASGRPAPRCTSGPRRGWSGRSARRAPSRRPGPAPRPAPAARRHR